MLCHSQPYHHQPTTTEERMAYQLCARPSTVDSVPLSHQWDRVKNTRPPPLTFSSITDTGTDSSSSTNISSESCLGRVVFETLDAKDYFSYDLNFAGKPEEWTCRSTMVEITNYEHRMGGQTVR